MDIAIPGSILDAVEQYMELYQVSKQLEERMQMLRKVIEPYMRDNGIDSIRDRNQTGKVHLTVQERSKMTSRYTTYEVEELAKVLDTNLMQRCLVEVVDKEKVEALSKLGEIPSSVSNYRSTTPTYSLIVRLYK